MRRELLHDDDIFVIHDFLTPEECARFIATSEAVGYGDAPIGGDAGFVVKDFRSNDRATWDDPATASALYDRARPFLPAVFGGRELCGFNERFRYYRYAKGQEFKWHFDGEYHRFNAAGEASKLTFMIYLNGGFTGGETKFNLLKTLQPVDGAVLSVVPAPGKALVFRHDILHTGAMVLDGIKYVMRTDVMFRPLG